MGKLLSDGRFIPGSYVGSKGKGKPKFSFRFRSYRERLSSPPTSKYETKLAFIEVPERLDEIEIRTELPEDIQDEEKDSRETTPREETLRHERNEQSMAALLDGLQDTSSFLGENSRKVCFYFSVLLLLLFLVSAYQFPSLFGDLVYPYDRFHENVVRYTRLGDPDSTQEMHPFA